MNNRRLVVFLSIISTFYFDPASTESCTVEKNGMSGECKFITDCPEVLMAYQKLRERPTICDSRLRTICCPIKVVKTTRTTTTTAAPLPPARVSVRKCREYGQLIYEKQTVPNPVIGEPPITKLVSKCNHEVVQLIVGGVEAKDREFPHMALIGFGEGREEDYQCGGSLISEQWILSAAHCVKADDSNYANFAKLGNVVRNKETPNSYTYRIIERVPHPNYASRFADDDIALFKLQQPAILNSYVIPICLPNKELFTTKSAIASGFGKTGFVDDASDVLMKVVIEYFNRNTCDKVFEDVDRFSSNQINWNKTICAGSTNKTGDTCNGDSGGPLQIYNNDTYCMYTIVGVTSFGFTYCGFPGVPAIYTKVYYYLDWIERIVWPNEF